MCLASLLQLVRHTLRGGADSGSQRNSRGPRFSFVARCRVCAGRRSRCRRRAQRPTMQTPRLPERGQRRPVTPGTSRARSGGRGRTAASGSSGTPRCSTTSTPARCCAPDPTRSATTRSSGSAGTDPPDHHHDHARADPGATPRLQHRRDHRLPAEDRPRPPPRPPDRHRAGLRDHPDSRARRRRAARGAPNHHDHRP